MYAIEPSINAIRLEYLQARNYYQRLGFNDIGPTADQIEKACHARRKMFKDAFNEFDKDDWSKARNLVEEAYDCLIQPHRRRRYDAQLQRKINGVPAAKNLVLSRYQIGQKLSDGDRTSIYEAFDTHLSRDVIIKKIAAERLCNAEQQALLRREAELFASNNSGHLVKILDFDAPKGIIVLEKMASNLASLSKPSGVDSHLVYELLEQALRGLDALHSQGLAHGRIDHEHLLLDDCDQVKLSITPGVSGIATALSPTASTKYIAPEMLNPGIFGTPGVAIDLYALGFVMLELLVGKGFAKKVNPGFSSKGSDPQSWLLWHASATDHLPPVQELCPTIEPSFAAVLEQMVAKDQNKRFASASECLAALANSEKPSPETMAAKGGRFTERSDVKHLGSPDSLTNTFQIERIISWKQILNEPQLLLAAEGRQHAAMLFVFGLIACSLMLILFGGSSPKNGKDQQSETKDSPPIPIPPIPIPPPPIPPPPIPPPPIPPADSTWDITFVVEDGGKVIAVDSLPSSEDTDVWKLLPGKHFVDVVDSREQSPREVVIELPEDAGVMIYQIAAQTFAVVPEPTPTIATVAAPQEVLEDREFHPSMFEMAVVGAKNIDDAVTQAKYLRSVLNGLCQDPTKIHDVPPPFVLPSRPVDPRFSFSLALLHYQQGDKSKAQEYCQRSLADAEHFGIVFMPSLQLRNRIHMIQGRCMVALADCRSTLSMLRGHRTRMTTEEISNTMSELAWWTGTLIGIIENTEMDKGKFNADAGYTSQYFQQSCSPNDWDWFEAGRRQSAQRATELTLAWQEYQSRREGTRYQNHVQRFNRHGYRKREKVDDRKIELEVERLQLQLSDPFADTDQYKTRDSELIAKTRAEDILVKPVPNFRGVSPHQFSNFVPDDTTVIAQRAYDSIVTPSGSKLEHYTRIVASE
ncbi:protein kinase domain-containing protein [Novipirellula sp. SH528]|uniref:protein kinase domain-containing protein n=1 Tax=Novipirellula sp. SH528 TaxID=3454466 RepID=UPI003FA05743